MSALKFVRDGVNNNAPVYEKLLELDADQQKKLRQQSIDWLQSYLGMTRAKAEAAFAD